MTDINTVPSGPWERAIQRVGPRAPIAALAVAIVGFGILTLPIPGVGSAALAATFFGAWIVTGSAVRPRTRTPTIQSE